MIKKLKKINFLKHDPTTHLRITQQSNNKSVIVLEGLAAVVNCVTCFVPVPGSTLYVHACHPRGALPAPGLAGCPVDRGE
jgi:hypothetical protein